VTAGRLVAGGGVAVIENLEVGLAHQPAPKR
jgi:hypothetical protein